MARPVSGSASSRWKGDSERGYFQPPGAVPVLRPGGLFASAGVEVFWAARVFERKPLKVWVNRPFRRHGSFMDGLELFDADHFGMSASEVGYLQHVISGLPERRHSYGSYTAVLWSYELDAALSPCPQPRPVLGWAVRRLYL